MSRQSLLHNIHLFGCNTDLFLFLWHDINTHFCKSLSAEVEQTLNHHYRMTFLCGRGCFFIRHTGSPVYTSISQEQNSSRTQINKLDVECDKQTNNNLYIFNESMFLKFHISSPLFCFPSFRNTVINTDQQLIQKKYV